MNSHFCCPICGGTLTDDGARLCCDKRHSFDKARSGYVNLLCSQRSASKRHGDDKRMLTARRDFLNRGFYAALRQALCDTITSHTPTNGVLLDAGCGEGYYTAYFAEQCPDTAVLGVDISKDALAMAAARSKLLSLCVASLFALPLPDNSVDTIVSVFAPSADAEFARVLKSGGTLIRAIPLPPHLFGLKAAIYETPRDNKPEKTEVDGLRLTARQELCDTLALTDPEDIRHLFQMTPYYYKTGRADQERVLSRQSLTTQIAFAILTYQKP